MKKVLAFVLFIGMAGQANADVFDTGSPGSFSFGGFTWDASFTNSDGAIHTGGDAAVGEVQIIGSDNNSGDPGLSTMSTAITESGTISVAWDYFTLDDLAEFDPFVWLVDGVANPTNITNDGLAGGQIGTFTQHVDAGTVFGLAISTIDNLFGGGGFSADVGLSGFSFTSDIGGNPVPVPPAFLLFGTALAGLGFFRKKKAAV